MTEHPILGQVALGYSPMIDRQRAVMATRLTVFPARPEMALDAAALLRALGEVWPASGGKVSLNVISESLLHDLMVAQPTTNMMIEVPAFMALDRANADPLLTLHANGNVLLLKGRPQTELPRDLLRCFSYSIIDLEEDRRQDRPPANGVARSIWHVQSGIRSLADMEGSFARNAVAVLGWPIEDAIVVASGKASLKSDMQTIVQLIQKVDRQEPIERIEAVLRLDPTLAFKLMRYINSPAFGLPVEISSFRHAIMMLGYQRLKRWFALLLISASSDQNMKPVTFAAVRRGLFMEQLVRRSGDEQMRDEAFICGVFSLLDRMMNQPFAQLLQTIPVSEAVYGALAEGKGPFQPYFDVVRAVEQESLFDIRESAERLMISVNEINQAQLRALAAAQQIE